MTARSPNIQFTDVLRLYQEGSFADARAGLEALLAACPQGQANWFALLGNILFKLGQKEAAADAFAREARLMPDKAGPFLRLAITLYGQCGAAAKIHDLSGAAFPILSGDPAMVHLLGEAALAVGDLDAVARMLPYLDHRAPAQVALKCGYYRQRGDMDALWRTLNEGVRDCPGDVYLMALRYAEARTVLDFDVMREYETIMQYPDTPLATALLSGEQALNRLFWCRSEALIARPSYESNAVIAATEALAPLRHPRRTISPAGRKLRVAYLSNDFTQHAVMGVFSEALQNHDPNRVDVTLLCYTPAAARAWQNGWPRHLQEAVVPIDGKQTVEVLDIIRHRGIDILVDLKGHTADARLEIVNLADVPVKVSYLGYPAAVTGAELDYAITDAFITPEKSRPFYAEKLCLLPHTSMPNASLTTSAPRPANRSDWGLPDDRFVFCSFNAVFKISPQTLSLWIRVLNGAPEALFWIRCDGETQRRNLLAALAEGGVDAGRVRFAEPAKAYQDHIDRVALADVSLDTMPYNGHATTTDMLRAGVPVVALRGTTSPSRMTDGLLHAVGMPDLVADTEDGFVSVATALAADPNLYLAVRSRLWENRLRSPLFDPALFARHLEQAYELMAERCRAGLAPDHITVPALPAEKWRRGVAA
jgi:predicted O-linked N-acetylglucosamine transferase (SPINDLY family)